jgi:hypothetical protein
MDTVCELFLGGVLLLLLLFTSIRTRSSSIQQKDRENRIKCPGKIGRVRIVSSRLPSAVAVDR